MSDHQRLENRSTFNDNLLWIHVLTPGFLLATIEHHAIPAESAPYFL
jgi:hypothetical protein